MIVKQYNRYKNRDKEGGREHEAEKNTIKSLEAKNTVLEIQMSLIGLINRMEITEENIQCS